MARINRRAPGLGQTLSLVARVNPSGKNGPNELKLLALAALHSGISRGVLHDGDAFEIGCKIIADLGLDGYNESWAPRTWMTIPRALESSAPAQYPDGPLALGRMIGSEVSGLMCDFASVRARFVATKESWAPRWDEVAAMLAGRGSAVPVAGTMSWRLMTPGKMRILVWQKSLLDLAASFGVSDTAVRAYCRHNAIPLPSGGFWRMTPARRDALRKWAGADEV